MYISDLYFVNFRNLKDCKIKTENGINIFYGDNGQGKTSLLEAIYFGITGKSFRTKNLREIFKYGFKDLKVFFRYSDLNGEKSIGIDMGEKKKNYYYGNKKTPYDDFIGKVNVISFIPEDIFIITGQPSFRRSYFDYEISQSNYSYYENLKEFDKILKVRNKFLKEKNIKNEIFEIYNQKFLEISAKIVFKRFEFIKKLSVILNLNYRKLFDKNAEISIKYSNFAGEISKLNLEEIFNLFQKISLDILSKEMFLGYSLIGPNRDDYIFLINNREAKSFASQGEKKSIIFSLKISEIDMVLKEKKDYPVFLIDDLSSYFDLLHKKSILKYFQQKNIQMFITSTEDLDIKAKRFLLKEGNINVED